MPVDAVVVVDLGVVDGTVRSNGTSSGGISVGSS